VVHNEALKKYIYNSKTNKYVITSASYPCTNPKGKKKQEIWKKMKYAGGCCTVNEANKERKETRGLPCLQKLKVLARGSVGAAGKERKRR
jgi:hypothetical protein